VGRRGGWRLQGNRSFNALKKIWKIKVVLLLFFIAFFNLVSKRAFNRLQYGL
jgi:hypothetical protein